MERRYSKLNWRDVKDASGINTCILPVGTIEAHGIIPLGTDIDIPERLALDTADSLNAFVLPSMPYGITNSLIPYPGSIDVSEDAFSQIIYDICCSIAKEGFQNIIIMNGHGGNNNALSSIKKQIWQETGMNVIIMHWWMFAGDICRDVFKKEGGHGIIDETAMMMHIDEKSVRFNFETGDNYYLVEEGIDVFPVPGPSIMYSEDAGKNLNDRAKADEFYDRVRNIVQEKLESVLKQLENNF